MVLWRLQPRGAADRKPPWLTGQGQYRPAWTGVSGLHTRSDDLLRQRALPGLTGECIGANTAARQQELRLELLRMSECLSQPPSTQTSACLPRSPRRRMSERLPRPPCARRPAHRQPLIPLRAMVTAQDPTGLMASRAKDRVQELTQPTPDRVMAMAQGLTQPMVAPATAMARDLWS